MSTVNSDLLDLLNLQLDSLPLAKKPELQRVIPYKTPKREPLDDTKLTALWQQAQTFFEDECLPSCTRIQKRMISYEPCNYDDLMEQVITLTTKLTEVTSRASFLRDYIPTMQDSYLQRDALSTSLYLSHLTSKVNTTTQSLYKLLASMTYRQTSTHYQKTVQDCLDLRKLATVDEKITGLFAIFKEASKSSRTVQFIQYTASCLIRETLEDQSDYKKLRLIELYQIQEAIAPYIPKPVYKHKPSPGTLQELEESITILQNKVQSQIKGIYFGSLPLNKEEYKEYEVLLLEQENSLFSMYDVVAKQPLGTDPKDWDLLEYLKTQLQETQEALESLKELTTGSLEYVCKALSKLISYLSLAHIGIMPDPNYIRLDTLLAHFEALDMACTIKSKDTPHFETIFKPILRILRHSASTLVASPKESALPERILDRAEIPEDEYELLQSYLMKGLLAHVYLRVINPEFQTVYRELQTNMPLMKKLRTKQIERLESIFLIDK